MASPRKIRSVYIQRNPDGEVFIYGVMGSGKSQVVMTIGDAAAIGFKRVYENEVEYDNVKSKIISLSKSAFEGQSENYVRYFRTVIEKVRNATTK